MRIFLGSLPILVALGVLPAFSMAPDAPASSLPFTDAQVAHGRAVYGTACALCHGANLQGAAGVALTGITFAKTWGDGHHNARDYYDILSQQMPKNAPGTLSEADNLALVAFILSRNGYAGGKTPLSLKSLAATLPAAPGAGAPPSSPSAGVASAGAPSAVTTARVEDLYPQRPASVAEAVGTTPTDADLLDIQSGDWLTYNRTLAGDRYSPLDQIDTRNVGKLRVKCMLQLGELGSFQASPIAYRGKLYVTTVHKVFALDGATCAPLWSYTWVPVDAEHLPNNRGVTLYRGKVFRGTIDGHLFVLDAQNGKLLWDVRVSDASRGYEITGAPLAFDGKVFVGDAGADVGIRGRIYAFDAATGSLIWSFDIIPTGQQPGAETWGGGTEQGGGSTWSSMAIDPERRLLFVPTGNPAPDFNDRIRTGANLYTDSVVALSLDTGKLAWYEQQVPHDTHDWDTAAAPALFEQNGRRYMAVASKNGLLYLYDRDSHATLAATPFTTRKNVDVPLSETRPVEVCPSALGQYNGPAYSPELRMMFLGAADRCNTLQVAEAKYVPGTVYFGGVFRMDSPEKQSGWIRGFDAATGAELWSVHRKATVLAAVTPTAGGLLFTGDSGGAFLALDAKSGRVLYEFATGGPIGAAISTYTVAGKQYVAVPSGNSSRDAASATGAATLFVFGVP